MFIGVGGPMGGMHVQRAIQSPTPPWSIVCTDVTDLRLASLHRSFGAERPRRGIAFICLNPMDKEAYAAGMAPFSASGFDDVIVLAPVPPLISDRRDLAAPRG